MIEIYVYNQWEFERREVKDLLIQASKDGSTWIDEKTAEIAKLEGANPNPVIKFEFRKAKFKRALKNEDVFDNNNKERKVIKGYACRTSFESKFFKDFHKTIYFSEKLLWSTLNHLKMSIWWIFYS